MDGDPPESTRTDTLVPDTPLFRSLEIEKRIGPRDRPLTDWGVFAGLDGASGIIRRVDIGKDDAAHAAIEKRGDIRVVATPHANHWCNAAAQGRLRSEEHTSEIQSLMRISYAVFCSKKKKTIS